MSSVQDLLSCGCHNHNAYKMLQAHGRVGIKSFGKLRLGNPDILIFKERSAYRHSIQPLNNT